MFARQDHEVVKRFMFPRGARDYATHYEDVWRAFEHFKVDHERRKRKFLSWDKIPSDALVCIRWKELRDDRGLHWVLFQKLPRGYRVLDPGSWDTTLASIDLTACDGVNYSLATPRSRAQGSASVGGEAKKARKRPRRRSPRTV